MKTFVRILTVVCFGLAAHGTAVAADSSWTLTTGSGNWNLIGNWDNGVPGATSGTTSTDIATFGVTLTGAVTVAVDNNRNIGGMTFSSPGTLGYTFTGATNNLRLTDGGVIQTLATQGAHTASFRTLLVIQGDGGSATFSSNGSGPLRWESSGGISGVSTAGNTTTLTVNGSNANTPTASANLLSTVISDGTAGGKLALVKDGTGIWDSTGGHTFTGGFTLKAGRFRINSSSPRLGAGLVTLQGGTLSATATTGVAQANDIQVSGNFGIGNATNTGAVTLSGSMDLGNATRTVEMFSAGTFSGVISNGGLTKAGTASLTLSNANTYSGDTLVQAGTLVISNNLALQNSGFDTSSAGLLNATGFTTPTFGGLLGSTNLSTSLITGYGSVTSLTLNAQTGKSYVYGGVIANGASGMSLTKSGAGSQRLNGVNTYSGATSITGGILEVGSTGSINGTSGITINGGELKYNSSTALNKAITFTAGRISGTGTIGTAVTVAGSDIIAPGNSPGSQAYSAGLTWSPGGTYEWEINNATGVDGTNWDIVNVSGGALDLSGLSAGSPFTLDLITLNGTAAGSMANYVDGQSYTFPLASYSSLALPVGFSGNDLTSLFTLSFTKWANPKPALANVSVVNNTATNTLDLVVVPEPATLTLAGAAVVVAGWSFRRRLAAS